MKQKIIDNLWILWLIFIIAVIVFAWITFAHHNEVKCKINGGKVIYDRFGLYEKCISGDNNE